VHAERAVGRTPARPAAVDGGPLRRGPGGAARLRRHAPGAPHPGPAG
jgi:hypothetical protein